MAIPRTLIPVLLSLGGIATAHAASFDCARARTGVEKAICADPKLSEYDERIAAAYKRGLGEWNGAIRAYVRNDQRQWLAEIRRIDDARDDDIGPVGRHRSRDLGAVAALGDDDEAVASPQNSAQP